MNGIGFLPALEISVCLVAAFWIGVAGWNACSWTARRAFRRLLAQA